jgi:mycofactocin glycosyltransferase
VASRASGRLARRLTDAGLAHPEPPEPAAAPDVTVIIPARDRADLLQACLAALGERYPVLVVDDGSSDALAVADAAARHHAALIRRPVNGGPAAARNTALAATATDLIAFVDSDCVPSPDWIARLAAHFADPLVAAAAPRITGLAPVTWAGRYTTVSCPLDLGGRPARVLPRGRVCYVPTAALVVRRAALAAVARDGEVFDAAMRTGEDVDLVWRLHEAGWRVRYDPAATVAHHEPATWTNLLLRRYRYGTSAALLARRHPGAVPPLVLHPWPTVTVAALLARRPVAAAAGFAGSVLALDRALRRTRAPRQGMARAMLAAARQTWLGIGRYGTQFAAPLLAAVLAVPGGRTAARRWGRRAAAGSLLLGPPLAAWADGPRALDPVRFALGRIADDIAYGLGVWSGCARWRTAAPVRPLVAWHQVRMDQTAGIPSRHPRS